jgi:hypothetical protein
MTDAGELENLPKGRRLVLLFASLLGLTAALCTVFALVVTAAESWQDHVHTQWPEASAQVQQCGLDIYTHKPDLYRIDCTVTYTARSQQIVSHVFSRSTPAPRRVIWQYPPHQYDSMQQWVDAHPQGAPIAVHYDPANPVEAVLVVTDMPLAEPTTPGNLKLLAVCAASSVLLLTIARLIRPRPIAANDGT